MFERQKTGSVVCPTCGRLVAVDAARCVHCGRWSPGFWGYGRLLQRLGDDFGFVNLVTGGCIVLYLLTLVSDVGGIGFSGLLGLLSPSGRALVEFGASGSLPTFGLGRWWTVLSASWLHGSFLHILFNLLWVRQLVPPAVRLFGVGRTALVYLVSGVTGFVLTSVVGALFGNVGPYFLHGAQLTIGASASIFGLLGALVLYGRRSGSTAMGRQVWTWALVLFFFGFLLPGIDNYAHLGGFLGGFATARVLDPLRPEKPEHLIAAGIGLALTLCAVIASVVVPFG
ncbi:MAG: rhomboid family intramembrane serine protease [Thermoanaerobaculia bacterium]